MVNLDQAILLLQCEIIFDTLNQLLIGDNAKLRGRIQIKIRNSRMQGYNFQFFFFRL